MKGSANVNRERWHDIRSLPFFAFFFILSCKVSLARFHRHLVVSKAPEPSSTKIGMGGLDARLHQLAGEGARRRSDLEPIVSKLTFTGPTETGS